MSIKNLNPFFYLLVSFSCLSNTLTANTVISTLIDQPVVVEIAGEYNWASDLDGVTLWVVVDEEDGHPLKGTTTFENGNQLIAFELLEEFDGSVFFLAPESLSGHAGVAMLEISDSEEIEASRYFFLNDSQLYAEETSAELYPEYSSSLRNYTYERIDNERGSIRIDSGNGTDEVTLTFSDWESGTWSDSTATGNWQCYDFNSSDVPIEYHSLIEEHTLGHHQDRQIITSHPYEIDSNGYLKVTETTSTQYYNVVIIEDGIIGTIQDDQGIDSVKNDGVNTVDQWFFTTLAAAEEFYNVRVISDWEDYDDFSSGSLDSGKWEVAWFKGGRAPTVVNGALQLGGSGDPNDPASDSLPYALSLLDIPESMATHPFTIITDSSVYGLEAEIMLPSGSQYSTGLNFLCYDTTSQTADGSFKQFGPEIEYWSGQNPALEYQYLDPSTDEVVEVSLPAEFGVYYKASLIQDGNKSMIFINDELVANFYYPDFSPNAYGFFAFNDEGHPFETYVKNVRVLRRSKEPEPVTLISSPSGQPVVVEIGGNYNWASDLDGVMLWSVEKGSGSWSSSTAKFDNGNLLYAFEFAENVTDSGNNKASYEIDANGYIKSLEQDGDYQYYNVVSVENGIIETLEGDQGVESVTENGINEVGQWFFTTRTAAEEFYGDRSGEDWATYDDIGATATVNYPDGYAPDSIDGFNVTVFEDGEIFNTIFSDGIRTDSTGDSAPYTYEKTSANEATITLLFENETSLYPEVTTIKFLSPNNGSFIWREHPDNTFQTVLDQGSGTWQMNAGFERAVDTSIPESSSQYPNGYALESIDGLKVTIWDGSDSETLTFSNGYRYTNEEETTKYIYEKTGANEGKITYPFEDESGAVEISQITFLSPNHGTFSWTEYSDSTTNTVLDTSTGNWSILPGSVRSNLQEGYYTGGNPTQVSVGEYVLSGSASSVSSAVKMPPELLPIIADDPAGNSFLFIDEAEDVVGIEGKVMLPSTNAIGSGIYISLWDATPLNSLGIELVKTGHDNASLRFESDENGNAQDIIIPAELDKNYTLRVTHRLGKSSFYIDGEEVGALRTATTPDYWGFGAFNADGLSDYNGTVSDIKILNKYPVADYSSPVLQDASGLSIIEKSNSNDYHWGLDLNGTTMWAYSPDLGHKRFKYEFKEDTVVRSTINQWDDSQTDEEVTLPYSLSADGFLFIQGADHGDEYLNVVGVDGVVISTKYGTTKSIAEHEDFSDFSHTVATEDGKLRTLEISDNGEDPDSFSITDDLGNSLVGFNAIEDLIEYLEEQDENATFPKSIELINQPIISLLQMYIADNNKTDFFYTDFGAATDHFSGMAFERVELGPLSFHVFKGSSIEKNLPYGKNGMSDYLITTPLSFEGINTSTHLTTEYTDKSILTDLDDLALMVAQQFVEKGSTPSDIIIEPVINDYSLDVKSIHRIYNDPLSGAPLLEYSILIDLNHMKSSTYWLSAKLTGVDEPIEHSSFESALSIARSFYFDAVWEETRPSLDDFGSGNGTTNTFDNVPTFEHSVSVPFKVTEYSGTQNWYNSSWFGDFFQSSNGWIFHPDLGWLYPVISNDQESCWMYAEDFGWIWVDSYHFPLFYSDVRSNWIYYYYYAPGPVFWDYEEDGWSNPGTSPIAVDEIEASNTDNYQNWELEMFNNLW